MFCEVIKIKQGVSYRSFCPLRILYNSKCIIMARSSGTNAIVVMRVHCIHVYTYMFFRGDELDSLMKKITQLKMDTTS